MSNVNSNSMSDYDFAELPDRDIEQDEFINNANLQRMDPAVLTVLNGFNLSSHVLERFAKTHIMFTQLSALDEQDLISLGVSDSQARQDMLTEFKNLEGQEAHLDALLRSLNDPERLARHETSVIDLIQNQLMSMNTLLAATIIKVGASKSAQSPGVVVNKNFASPEVVLKMLQQMTGHADAMMALIKKMKYDADAEEDDDPKKKLKVVALIVSGIVIGFCIFKQLRGGNKLI